MEPQACSVHDFLITSGIYSFTRCFHAFIRGFHTFTRGFHAFTREFRAFTREFRISPDIFSHSSVFPKEKDKACQLCPCSCFP